MLVNACGGEVIHFTMTRNSGAATMGWIFQNGVFASFPQQLTVLLAQMIQQITPFHATTASGLTLEAAVNNK